MTPRERARQILQDTAQRPTMFCASREALLARCSAILEMADVFDPAFYVRHFPNSYDECVLPLTAVWAKDVLTDALQQLDTPTTQEAP